VGIEDEVGVAWKGVRRGEEEGAVQARLDVKQVNRKSWGYKHFTYTKSLMIFRLEWKGNKKYPESLQCT